MSAFREIAMPLAERGFRVFPLIPKEKRPVRIAGEFDHFDAASTDPEQIRVWQESEPNANVGLSPDEIFCFLETDDEAALKEACNAAGVSPEVWDTTRVSARENRCYYIFRQTMRTKAAGNMTATRADQTNLFEFKQYRMYVAGPGSIHPKTGLPYLVEWRAIPAMPDVLLNLLCEVYGKPKPGNTTTMNEDVKRETALLDSFLETYEVATLGDWFNSGKQWIRAIECPWRDAHENKHEGTSTCVFYTEGGGYGFQCKHKCGQHWADFRAEMESRFPDRKFAFVKAGPGVTIGGHKRAARVGPWNGERVEAFMQWHHLDYRPPVKIAGRVMWVCRCPFDETPTSTSPALILTPAGWLKWACKHNSCYQMKFREFLMRINFITGKVYGFSDLKGQP
jgi:hypothetical protein